MGGIVGAQAKAYASRPSAIMPYGSAIGTPNKLIDPDQLDYSHDVVSRINWITKNCAGRYEMVAPEIVVVGMAPGFSEERLTPPRFIFELDDDAVLFKMKFEGSK